MKHSILVTNKKPGSLIFWIMTLLILLAAGCFVYSSLLANPCDLPIRYSIGSIDSRFKVTPVNVRQAVDDAASRWNADLGKRAYMYDPAAKLKVNLVYDERQQKLDQTKMAIAQFDKNSQSIEDFRNKVEQLSAVYQQDLNNYNNRVNYWNLRGGAPSEIFTQLNNERSSLDQRRSKINSMASLLNTQISDNNNNIEEFNATLQKDRNKIITSGEYFTDGTKINIYTYGDSDELRLVLMHELGHAMSFEHDKLSNSIMYPTLQDQDMSNPLPTTEDLKLMNKICGTGDEPLNFEILLYRLRVKLIKISAQQS